MGFISHFALHKFGVLFGSTNGFKRYPWSHQVFALPATRWGLFITISRNKILAAVNGLITTFYKQHLMSSPSQPNIMTPTPPNRSAVVFNLWRSCCHGSETRRTPSMWRLSRWHLGSLLLPNVSVAPWCLMTWWEATWMTGKNDLNSSTTVVVLQ